MLEVPVFLACCSINYILTDIWHHRLVYSSYDRLVSLKSQLMLSSNRLVCPCNAYHKAKQRRHSFPNHVVVNNKVFCLVHIDVWDLIPKLALIKIITFLLLFMMPLDMCGFFL